MVENKYVPIKTTIAPAPERLLKVVKCVEDVRVVSMVLHARKGVQNVGVQIVVILKLWVMETEIVI